MPSAAALGLLGMMALAVFLYRRYRRGQYVAVTTDGLIMRLVGHGDDLIAWSRVVSVTDKNQKQQKPQIARLQLREPTRSFDLGGLYNVFPTRAAIEQFVEQVQRRSRLSDQDCEDA